MLGESKEAGEGGEGSREKFRQDVGCEWGFLGKRGIPCRGLWKQARLGWGRSCHSKGVGKMMWEWGKLLFHETVSGEV